MENSALVAGIPAIANRSFKVAKYNADGTSTDLLRVAQNGDLFTTGAVNPSSDRNQKENFAPVKPLEMLDKVVALPITRWNYKSDIAAPHLGPVAQDFHAAFGLGTDDKHIATVDADGVALAAIQGLNQKLNEQLEQKETKITKLSQKFETELKRRDAENAELKQRLERLERLMRAPTADSR